ncbi:MAG: alpha/beta hydrolase [Actinobacteria bacterium]|nr:alpha/beta hydrolase [Actinomycetota bacterium]
MSFVPSRPSTRRLALLSLLALFALLPSGAAAAGLPGKLVPGSRLPGAAAFEGPVRTVAANGVRLGYRQFGHGPDLVMITGDTAPMSLWMPYLLQPLARDFTVTIFDNRGVGYSSDDLSQRLSVPLMARDTAALITALGLERPTVVGWSMGGEIGLTLAERRPALLGALVTTGADAGSHHTKPPPPGLIRQLANPKAGIGLFLRVLFPANAAGGAASARFVHAIIGVPQEKVSQRTLRRQERAEEGFLRYDGVWDALGTITTPTLITNGALDRANFAVNARRLHSRISGSRLAIYPGAGHGMLFQDATRFAAEISSFAAG